MSHVSKSEGKSQVIRFILILFCIALSIRLYYLFEISHHPLFNYLILDAEFHDKWAQSISRGNFWGDTAFFRAPFYPYFLGFEYWIFGHGYIIPRILQHFLGGLAVVLLYLLARRMFGHRVAALSAYTYALYPIVFYFEDQLLVESLLNVQVILLFTIIAYEKDKPSVKRWFCIGLVLGITIITRPTFLPLIPLLLVHLWIASTPRHQKKVFATLMLSLILGVGFAVFPVTLRNYIVGGDKLLVASQGGINFYIGNNAESNGYSSMLPTDSKLRWEYREISYPVALSIGREPKPSEISDYWYSQGLHFIVTQPIDFIQLLAKKFYLFWNRFEIPNNQSFYSFLEYSTVLKWLPVGFWAIGPLGILGAILSWRQQQARLIVSFIMLYCLIVIAFFVCDRFRLPILPFLCVFSARAVTQMWDDFRAKRFRPLAMALILLLAFGGFTNSNIYNFQTEIRKVDLFHLGNAALDQLRFVDAISYFDQSDREPGHLKDTYLNRGVAQWKLNRPQPALIDFGRELKYFPRSYEALTNLSHIFLLQGVNDSTLVYSMKAIEIKPFAAPAYVDLAMAYDNLGQEYKAESVLVQGKKKCGSDFLYGESVLAGIHLVQGKHDDAMREYRSVLSRIEMNEQPQYKPEFRFGNSGQFASDPDEFKAKIFYSLGHIFLLKELVDSAAYYFTAATNLLPTFSQAWIDLGSTLHELRKSDESKSAYKRGLEIDSKSVIGWYNLGMLLIERGETTQATLALKNATKLKPEFAPAQGALDSISVATYR